LSVTQLNVLRGEVAADAGDGTCDGTGKTEGGVETPPAERIRNARSAGVKSGAGRSWTLQEEPVGTVLRVSSGSVDVSR